MKKLLIVEDETLISLDLKNRMERNGYRVLPIANSAARAIEIAVQERPDIILVDIVLKGDQDGIDAARAIVKKFPVPILFITGNVKFIDRERLRNIPVYRILGKPAFENVLLDAIAELLSPAADRFKT
jgi:CheY-like chemotaxis protein